MKKVCLIIIIVLNFIVIGVLIFQNNYMNTKFEEIDKTIEYLSASDNQQKIQINQLTEKQRKAEQQEAAESTNETTFENTSTDGLKAITEDEAKKIWEEYLTNNLSEDINKYNCDEIKTVNVRPNNCFTANGTALKVADFEREAYLFKYKKNDNLEEIDGYVDIYTGKVIAGSYNGD